MRRFLAIVGKRDEERFRRFATGQDRPGMSKIAQLRRADRVWALGKHVPDDTWSRIRRGDHVIFARHGMPFSHLGTVSGTLEDAPAAAKLWGDTPRTRLLGRMVKFSSVREISEPFRQTCERAGVRPGGSTTIHEAEDPAPPGRIRRRGGEAPAGVVVLRRGAAAAVVPDGGDAGPPERVTEAVTRFHRDTGKAKRIKSVYKDRCQICGYVLDLPGGRRYSEVHHLRPLRDGGDDDLGNMLVLCARHHVEFDYLVIGVSEDGRTVIGRDGSAEGTLDVDRRHNLERKNILFHLGRVSGA